MHVRTYRTDDWEAACEICNLGKPDELRGLVDPGAILPLQAALVHDLLGGLAPPVTPMWPWTMRDATAVVFGDERLTYAQFGARVSRAANLLSSSLGSARATR